MHPKALRNLILKKKVENSNLFDLSRNAVASICKRRNKFKQKCGLKRKISQQNGRKIVRSVQKMINTSENVTARKVLIENDVSVI